VTPCTLVYIYYFKEPAGSSFYPEKEAIGSTKNAGKDIPDYMISYPGKASHSCKRLEVSQVWNINCFGIHENSFIYFLLINDII
jgi:hypothetical protein